MNHGWEKKTLSEVCQKESSNLMQKNIDPEQGLYPVYGANNIVGYLDYYVQPKDYIGIIKDGSGVGRVNVYPKESSLLGTLQYIIPNDNMDLHYTAYVLQSMNLAKYASGAAIPHIYFKDYGKEKIGVPSLVKQKEIAEELNKINELIEVKRSQLADLDLLAQSLFYEMFGDPIDNPKGWNLYKLGDCVEFKNGLNFTPSDNGNEIKCLGVGNFKSNRYITDESLPSINIVELVSKEYLLKDGDIVFVRSNGNKALIGRSILYASKGADATFSGFCIRCRFDHAKYDPLYMVYLLSSKTIRHYMTSQGKGCNISNINQKLLSAMPFIVPPIELQDQFAAKIKMIEEQKNLINSSIADSQILLASRMDYWFNNI